MILSVDPNRNPRLASMVWVKSRIFEVIRELKMMAEMKNGLNQWSV
jgi:hypothetical protein